MRRTRHCHGVLCATRLPAAALTALALCAALSLSPAVGAESPAHKERAARAEVLQPWHEPSDEASQQVSAYLLRRLVDYCNFPPKLAEEEGVPPLPGAQLVQMHIQFRHGDRSVIHSLATTSRPAFPCSAPSPHEAEWASHVLEPWISTVECITHPETCENATQQATSTRIDYALLLWRTARNGSEACSTRGGELSSIGWYQLQMLGASLAASYRDLLLRNDARTVALHAVSTDTGRTVLSATAFLRGLLHSLLGEEGVSATDSVAVPARGVSGEVAEEDACVDVGASAWVAHHREPICQGHRHQLAWRADALLSAVKESGATTEQRYTSKRVPQLQLPLRIHIMARKDDPMMFARAPQSCDAALHYEEQHHDFVWQYEHVPQGVRHRLAASAGLDDAAAASLQTESIVDDLYTRMCHAAPMPCWDTNKLFFEGTPHAHSAIAMAEEVLHHAAGAEYYDDRVPDPRVAQAFNHVLGLAAGGKQQSTAAAAAATAAAGEQPADHTLDAASSPAVVCMPLTDAATMLAFGDRHYRTRYSTQSTRTLVFPFLSQVVTQLVAAARGESRTPRVIIRAAHDTVIAPTLSALGWRERHMAWPGYAARII
ncbi:histidine-type phosphatase, partial [archaeon]